MSAALQAAEAAGVSTGDIQRLRADFAARQQACKQQLDLHAAAGSVRDARTSARVAARLGLAAAVADVRQCVTERAQRCRQGVASALAVLLQAVQPGDRPCGAALSTRWGPDEALHCSGVLASSRCMIDACRGTLVQVATMPPVSKQSVPAVQHDGTGSKAVACSFCSQLEALQACARESARLEMPAMAQLASSAASIVARAVLAHMSRLALCAEVQFTYDGFLLRCGPSQQRSASLSPAATFLPSVQLSCTGHDAQPDLVLALADALLGASPAAALPPRACIWPAAARHEAQLHAAAALATVLSAQHEQLSSAAFAPHEAACGQASCSQAQSSCPAAQAEAVDVPAERVQATLAAVHQHIGAAHPFPDATS
jgi:hypothetical protein